MPPATRVRFSLTAKSWEGFDLKRLSLMVMLALVITGALATTAVASQKPIYVEGVVRPASQKPVYVE